MILGPGGGKLSKRHGATTVEEFRDQGYLAGAIVNYLALLGWAPGDDREVLERDEMVAEFDLARIKHSAASFDAQKLEWMNAEHIRRLAVEDLAGEALPFAKARYGDAARHPRVRAGRRARAGALDDARADRRPGRVPVRPRRRARDRTGRDRRDRQARPGRPRARPGHRAHRDAASGRTTASTWCSCSKDRELKPAKHMKVLYAAIQGPHCGAAACSSRSRCSGAIRRCTDCAGHASGCRADETRVQDRVARRRSRSSRSCSSTSR